LTSALARFDVHRNRSGLERDIKEIDRLIKEARPAATTALTLEEKLAGQKQIKALEAQRNQKRRSLFDAQDRSGRQAA
jgi:adenine-specific DNA-methyltransferase